ncbi:tastin [Hemicordylus capensis]|uniref:tastin n=1 Tax=Hemicordylus capensis TaxID=884348 RepID=UPI002302F463|nr:tastin [Hemicordylus capensis]XP_053149749.1 tastin [Hemicordylus capensis]XP_053149750.1 tastin [Hemicordylus capensis]XP_053149751.1 tastin [Hemicordylus capensis]
MAQAEKENLQGTLHFPGTFAEPGGIPLRALSASKIPVLSKSRLPPEWKEPQRQSQLPLACPSSVKSEGIKTPKMTRAGPVPGAASLETAAGLLPKSSSREPLGEMQLGTSGRRNVVGHGLPSAKKANTVEFVPDAAALASILSNTGLTSQMVSASQKVSLARRVPLRGSRACSAIVGVGRGSLYMGAPTVNPVRMSCISRLASKDMAQPQSCSLALNKQQLKALSTTLENLRPGVKAKPGKPAEDLEGGECGDPSARLQEGGRSSAVGADGATQSNSMGRKETTGTLWKDEDFIPDPAAKASILSNTGLSHSAFGANGKLSLAQRVPVKDPRKPLAACGSDRDKNAALLESRVSAPPTEMFGRVSCRSMQGLKGLEKLEASEARLANTPGRRDSVLDYSPFGLARRVPVTCPRSLRRTPGRCKLVPLSSCTKDKGAGAQYSMKTPQGGPQTVVVGSKEDGGAVPWEKIAVRLFSDEVGALAEEVPAAPVITQGMGKLQRIKCLVQLLQQEMKGSVADYEVVPSLEELHKLLSAHCSPALEFPKPGHSATPLQDPPPNLCEQPPASVVAAAPEPIAEFTISTQQPAFPNSAVHLIRSPSSRTSSAAPEPTTELVSSTRKPAFHSVQSSSSRTSSTGGSAVLVPIGQVKQRLEDLAHAPNRFHEASLNDECAFYAARLPSVAQPSVPRCEEPVARMLEAHDAVHFIPISATPAALTEAQRSSPL